MPTIGVKRSLLFKEIGQSFTDEEFDQLCFDYGLELDDIEPIPESNGTDVEYKVEIPANRYDILCLEGLSRALKIFLQKYRNPKHSSKNVFVCSVFRNSSRIELPEFRLSTLNKDQQIIRMKVLPNTQRIRPIVVCAVLRNITFDNESYNSFIKLQEKLHLNLCRHRTLVAIGTHDLDTIKAPFIYDARQPQQIKFRSLNQQKEMQADEMLQFYLKDTHLKRYVPIIQDSDVYPVIYDSNGVVLSLPPIINGDHSKISVNTKNVFIECTATDLHKANIVLNIMLTMFAQYCGKPFEIEPVEVEQVDGKVTTFPNLTDRLQDVSVKRINQRIGINVDATGAATLLKRMSLRTQVIDSDTVRVGIPVTRADILHFCDIAEDCAVAYGFNNINKTAPKTSCIGNQFELNRVSDLLRHSVAESGFTEALTFTLCSCADVADKFGKKISDVSAVHIANPKTQEFQIGRTTLLPGLLRTIASNQGVSLPIQLFEISDVILKDPTKETGSRNQRHLCAVFYNRTPGFETIHGLLDRIMTLVKISYNEEKTNDRGYYLNNKCEDSAFFPGRHAQIIVRGENLGVIGVLHPSVIENFGLKLPCSILELNIEPFV